ncbi:glycosyltransferase family 2 protein [Kitasatospora sp. NPDC001660]
MTGPDVTVVVAVSNTMPHLIACLDSLVAQTLAPGRFEVVVVDDGSTDDGSTDGGAAVLADYAARHPGLFRVVHQPDSRGPDAPTSRALALARGRYVLFLGADDRLGAEALERLVAAADAWGSDAVVPNQAGVNGRPVPQGTFHTDAGSVGFGDSALVWALSDTKPFRPDLARRHGLCRDEGPEVFSGRPFAPEACARADRVFVLADYDYDYDCHFLVLREDLGDVTERACVLDRLRGIAALQHVAADLAEPGEELDAIRARSFTWDVPRLLRDDFLLLDAEVQHRVCAEVGRLVEGFGARAVYHRLPVADRLRLELAAAGRPQALRDLIRYEAAHGEPPVVVEGRRHYAGYPAFRDGGLGLPDELFFLREVAEEAAPPPLNLAQQLWRGIVPEHLRRGLRRIVLGKA